MSALSGAVWKDRASNGPLRDLACHGAPVFAAESGCSHTKCFPLITCFTAGARFPSSVDDAAQLSATNAQVPTSCKHFVLLWL